MNGNLVADTGIIDFIIDEEFMNTYTKPEKLKVKCEHCTYLTAHAGNLGCHVKRMHTKESDKRKKPRVECETCGKTYSNVDSLKKHIKRKHSVNTNTHSKEYVDL